MMRKTFIAAALSMVVGLTFAMPAAEAGGGMGFGSGASTCRLVLNGGPNQPQTVSITDAFVSDDAVKVGALVLLCDLPAIGETVAGPATGTPIPEGERSAVACYAVTGADSARIATTVQDPFTTALATTGTKSVSLGAIQLLCVPAATTNP
jgi:hypothetical protein